MQTIALKPSIIDYILVLLLLCFSGNPAFVSVENTRELFIGMSLITAIICIFKGRWDIFTKFLIYISLYLIIYLLQIALVANTEISGIIFVLLKTFIGCGVILLMGQKFSQVYINIMILVCVISLVFFGYNYYVGILPGLPTSDHTLSLYVYTELIELDGSFKLRNSGMFWEPGAFEAYINIALFFLAKQTKNSKWDFVIATLFIFTILTTYSTTGYVVMATIIFYYLSNNNKMSPIVKWLFVIAAIIIFIHLYSTLDILGEKITNSATASSQDESRLTDFFRFSSLIFTHPLIGNSYIDDIFSGNGFVLHLVFVGFLGVIYYWYNLYVRVKKQVNPMTTIIFLLVIFLTLQGEVLISYPLYLAFPFIKL